MGWVYLLLALAALGGGAYGVRTYNLAIEEAEKNKAKAAEFASAYEQLAAGLQRVQSAANAANDLAAKRNSRAIAAEKGRDEARRELENLKERNSDVKTWADTPLPAAVRLSLDGGGSAKAGANLPAAADGSSTTNPKP